MKGNRYIAGILAVGLVFLLGACDAVSSIAGDRDMVWQDVRENASYTVKFDSSGGTTVAPQTVRYGGDVSAPANPTRSGFGFNGWYRESTFARKWVFAEDTVTTDITLYAKWTPYTLTISYADGGGTGAALSAPVSAAYGSNVTMPANTYSYTDYTFTGWTVSGVGSIVGTYAAGTNIAVADLSSAIVNGNAEITLTAKWLQRLYISSSGIEMIWIPAGSFQMGSPTDEPGRQSDETQHTVTLTSDFYMGKYEVTQAQYQAVMGTNPSYFKNPVSPEVNTDNRPVEQLSWYSAIVYCNRLSEAEGLSPAYEMQTAADSEVWSTDYTTWGTVPAGANDTRWNAVRIVGASSGYRLPTEAQWEYACRAGTASAFNWETDTINSTQANYYASYIDANNKTAGTYLARTTVVSSYAPNLWGLYDMHGNVWEWCWDWYGSYSGDKTDPSGAVSGDFRVLRGGSWLNNGQFLRSAYRHYSNPYGWNGSGNVGFRLVRP